jgi:hypothetical protein
VRWRRRFGYPGRIDDYERVWLTFQGMTEEVEVWLNGQTLGRNENGVGPFEFDVTARLKPRNELCVEIGETTPGGPRGEVALEVRCTAYLRGVRVWQDQGGLHAQGQVVGTAERPLELYLIRSRSTIAYATTEATSEGTPFLLRGEGGQAGTTDTVRVDLVNGATIWYAFETAVQPESTLP